MLTHGFPDNIHLYDQLYPLLAGRREVIAFDWIGWGQSDKPAPKGFPYTSSTMSVELCPTSRATVKREIGAPRSSVWSRAVMWVWRNSKTSSPTIG